MTATTNPTKGRARLRLVAGAAVLLAVGALGAAGAYTALRPSPEDYAQRACQDFIPTQLTKPATVKSVKFPKVMVEREPGFYTVGGDVVVYYQDGGAVRSGFVCKVEHLDGDRWHVVSGRADILPEPLP